MEKQKECMNKRKIGAKYEQLAKSYLENKGYQILEMNYRRKTGEIDIIAREKACIVFIEVKYRAYAKYGYPREAVHFQKQKKIITTAKYFLKEKGCFDNRCRFDIIEILGEQVTHLSNAFIGGSS